MLAATFHTVPYASMVLRNVALGSLLPQTLFFVIL